MSLKYFKITSDNIICSSLVMAIGRYKVCLKAKEKQNFWEPILVIKARLNKNWINIFLFPSITFLTNHK